MKRETDRGKCRAAGQRVAGVPDVFDQNDEDGTVILLDTAPPPDQYAAVREAAGIRPALAITLREG